MRIDSISIEWFRGAAATVTLPLAGKSIAIYGPNGGGKSSFVDAIEYLLCDGKIGHLTHEYSGKKQEKGVINTEKPTLTPARARIDFIDKTSVEAVIQTNGSFSKEGAGLKHIAALDYRRVVLRQDEVARFVSSPKGEKYSALLPLLGLESLETAAENVRQLAKRLEKRSEIDKKRGVLTANRAQIGALFVKMEQVEVVLQKLYDKYLSAQPRGQTLSADCNSLEGAIRKSVQQVSPDAARHAALRGLAGSTLESALAAWETADQALTATATRMLAERVDMLERAKKVARDEGAPVLECPVCGREVGRDELTTHVEAELLRLAGEQKVLEAYRSAENDLVAAMTTTRQAAIDPNVTVWWLGEAGDSGPATIDWLKTVKSQDVRGRSGAELRERLTRELLPMVKKSAADSRVAPPGTEELVEDHALVRKATAFIDADALESEVARLERLGTYLSDVERAIRDEIGKRSDAVVGDISTDVQRMWGILHPGHEIENVRLSHPDDADKAIDIELKFFGLEQRSPRLTLSEGNRNSLGLCVFLSMAKRADKEVPVILDDVVVSLDREHRGTLVELLQAEFSDRQVVILTHDRDWFAELGHLLAGWGFRSLRPYTRPSEGIAWSDRVNGLDEARAYLNSAPDTAANVARKIMDTQLALLADKLRLTMEFRQGHKNDQRLAHDFLTRLISACEKAYQVRNEKDEYEASSSVKQVLAAADRRVIAWGNRGSHTFDVVRAEAELLIKACEEVLELFHCGKCKQPIYKMDDSSKMKQCHCGAVRWRYDKA